MNFIRWCAGIGTALFTLPVLGQAPAPTLAYSSAFAGYRPYQDPEPENWRAVNDMVLEAASKSAAHGSPGSPAHRLPAGPASSKTPPPSHRGDDSPSIGHSQHPMRGGAKQ